ncbi:hypothetical protein D8M33_04075 [Micrococcus sp. HSID17245]|nr:hypothetical protein D8M33_04075 [Micrococcus sp. HSID17245]
MSVPILRAGLGDRREQRDSAGWRAGGRGAGGGAPRAWRGRGGGRRGRFARPGGRGLEYSSLPVTVAGCPEARSGSRSREWRNW